MSEEVHLPEPEEGADTWKAMIYELHVELKHGKRFACRYGCGDHYGIGRINTHMFKLHGWKYPKLGVGQKAPTEIHEWKPIWATWKENMKNDDNFQSRPLSKPPSKMARGPVAGKKTIIDFKVDWRLDRSVIEEKAITYAKYAVPDEIVESPPLLLPVPLICEIFTPQYLGEASFTDAYVEKIHKMLFNATHVEFDSALSKLCESKSEEDAKSLKIEASSEYFYFLLSLENRAWVLSIVERAYEDVKQYVADVQAGKAWEEDRTSKQEKVERKRAQIVAAKLLEYDSLQPASVGKDLESRKRKYRDQLAFHTKEIEQIRKALEMLEDVAVETVQGQVVADETVQGQVVADETVQGQVEEPQQQVVAAEIVQGQVKEPQQQVQLTAETQGQAEEPQQQVVVTEALKGRVEIPAVSTAGGNIVCTTSAGKPVEMDKQCSLLAIIRMTKSYFM